MASVKPNKSNTVGTPYPLKRNYFTRAVPAMIVLMCALSAVIWFAFERVTTHIYLEQAQDRTGVILESVIDAEPDAWAAFISGKATQADLDAISVIFNEEVERERLITLKVYDLAGNIIYDIDPLNIGRIETAQSLREVLVTEQATLMRKPAATGAMAYEIYVPYLDPDGNLRAVLELYEEVGYLDSLMLETAVPAILLPAALQILLMLILGVLVRRAQRDIDQRTDAIGQLSQRLETFVSASALQAAKNAEGIDTIPSRKMGCTLFHSDVRDFSSFAEDNPPERVVFFLNDLMTIQVEIIDQHGGDVDKMIGDALLVRFEGDDAQRRAIQAAKEILDAARRASLSRGLGIGIYTGQVISGAIGPKSRRDFTVIGDSVNMSARLCSQAGAGELVADAATVEAAGDADFGATETVQVKGHVEPLAVRRWHAGPSSQAS